MTREQIIHSFQGIKKIAEVGVLRGKYSKNLLELDPDELHLIDPYKFFGKDLYSDHTQKTQSDWDATYEFIVSKFAKYDNVKIHRMTSVEAAAIFPDNYFDLVYIDGNHSYDFVTKDLEAWMPKVKSGGYLSGHDIEVKGVYNALCDFFDISKEYEPYVYDQMIGDLIITTEYSKETKGSKMAKSWFYKKQ